mgnify:CR=1 FL=1
MEKKSSNKNLHNANRAKKDEFYTQLIDIENELKHYKNQFENKVVYCNCDDPFESNFFKFFAANFNALKLKKLIATSYSGSPIVGRQLTLDKIAGLKPKGKEPFKIEINEVPDIDGDGAIDIDDVKKLLEHDKNIATPLADGGDFRSPECVELLKQADIVVTNPPFSLFREYVAQLVEHNKKFLIIGNVNAITYKECFKFIKGNKMWLGITMDGRNKWFQVPDSYPINQNVANSKIENGKKYLFVKGCVWFTNLDNTKRHEKLNLYKKYSPEEYPKYDNYDAIEVSKVAEIPINYKGAMGVPITFFNKYNPSQFEIIGMCENEDLYKLKTKFYTTEECKNTYYKIFDKKGTYDLNASGVINGQKVYQRILIKNKKVEK